MIVALGLRRFGEKETQAHQLARMIIDDGHAINVTYGGGFLLVQINLPKLVGLLTLEALNGSPV